MTTRPVITAEEVRLDILARDLVRADVPTGVALLIDVNQGLAEEGPYVVLGRVLEAPVLAERPTAVLPTVNPWE